MGAQKPTRRVVPASDYSDGYDAVEFASGYGLHLDDWQADIIIDWLARTKAGRYSARVCGLSVPRQNGKNAILEMRELFGLVFLKEKFLHTAHEVKTARKAFLRLVSFFEDNPELKELVREIRRTNGQEAIYLYNGASIEFVARSRGSARGFTVDVVVLDEAQELDDEHMEALMPTLAASPTGDQQLIMCGTPPKTHTMGEVFRRTRNETLAGKNRAHCWHEWSVKGIGDVSDRARWYATNPALGIRIDEDFVESELATLSEDGFARERLGWWAEAQSGATIIPLARWKECSTDIVPPGTVSYGVKFSPDGAHVALAVASKPEVKHGNKIHVEIVEYRSTSEGLNWLADWLIERKDKAAKIAIDGRSGADVLRDRLLQGGIAPRALAPIGTKDVIAASSLFLEAIRTQELTHFDQEILNSAIQYATKRKIGKGGGFGFASISPDIDESVIEAASLAHYASKTTHRKPGRKARVI